MTPRLGRKRVFFEQPDRRYYKADEGGSSIDYDALISEDGDDLISEDGSDLIPEDATF